MTNSKYYTKTALLSMAHNRLMTISSVLTIGCCLFLFSVFLLFTVNINSISDQIQSQCEIQAYIDIAIDGAEAEAIAAEIARVDNVAETTYETKAEAFQNYAAKLGGNSIALEGLEGEDFLRNSVKMSLTDLSQAQETADAVAAIPGVAEVINHQDTVDNVLRVTGYVQKASLIIMLILMVVSLFIISNTIRLSVASRANEIHIMKFVGATNWFIRWPFIIEGIFIGLIGGIVALGVTFAGYIPLYDSVTSSFTMLSLCPPKSVCGTVIGLVLLFGCLMGAFASTISTTRHLKV